MKNGVALHQKILLVSENSVLSCTMSNILERAGFKVVSCRSASDALNKISIESPDVLIVDLHMTEMDGWQFCRSVRAMKIGGNGHIPMLMISAVGNYLKAERLFRRIGVDDFLGVPYEADQLVGKINRLIHGGVVLCRRSVAVVIDNNGDGGIILPPAFFGEEYEVRYFKRCEWLAQNFRAAEFDIVAMVGFPPLECEALVSAARRCGPQTAIVTISGKDVGRHCVDMFRAGADVCLNEPLDRELFLIACDKALKERSFSIIEEILRRHCAEAYEVSERYRNITEAMSDGMYICNADYRVEYMSPALSKLLEKVDNSAECYRMIYGRSSVCPWCCMREVQQGRRACYEASIDQKRLEFVVSVAPLHRSDGTVGHMGIMRNVTVQKRYDEQAAYISRLRAFARVVRKAAHEFNNQLGAIMGYADLIRESNCLADGTPRDTVIDKRIGIIISSTNRAAEIMRRIRSLWQYEEKDFSVIDVHTVLKEVSALLGNGKAKGIEIISEYGAAYSTVMGSAVHLRVALHDLVSVFCGGMADGCRLVFRTEIISGMPDIYWGRQIEGNYILVSIVKCGEHFSYHLMKQFIEPLLSEKIENGDETEAAFLESYAVVLGHGGDIDVKDVGSDIILQIYLPLAQGYCCKRISNYCAFDRNQRGTVLLLDDEELARQACTILLEQEGFRVRAFGTAVEAVQFFAHEHRSIDLVVVDIVLPDRSGYECYREMRKIDPSVCVIFVTGYEIDASIATELRGNVVIQKPFNGSTLRKAVESVSGRTVSS